MSLADELLADLEENDQDDLEDILEPSEAPQIKVEDVKEEPMEQDTTQISSVRELCKLRDSETLKNIIEQVKAFSSRTRKQSDIIGPVESDPEYQLIVEANNTAADVDNEIGLHINSLLIVLYLLLKFQQQYINLLEINTRKDFQS